jgi:nicotinamidase/pyrazinamidase
LYVPGGEDVLDSINTEIKTAIDAGSPVFYTQDWHPETTPHFAGFGGIWPVHCVRGTDGAALHPRLTVTGHVVRKGTDGSDGYSGFSVRDPKSGQRSDTELGGCLRAAQVRTVVVVGLAGDYCVKDTALDAVSAGFEAVVPLALTRFVNRQPGDDDAAVAAMRTAGVVVLPTYATTSDAASSNARSGGVGSNNAGSNSVASNNAAPNHAASSDAVSARTFKRRRLA